MRGLDGEEWSEDLFIGRVCERFHCLPSAASQEWAWNGWQLDRVMEALAVAETKQAMDTRSKEHRPTGELVDLIDLIEFAAAREALDKKKKGDG